MDTVATVRRWMAGLLAVAYLFDLATNTGHGAPTLLLPLPLVAAVFLALYQPVLGALAGAGAVVATSAALWWLGVSGFGSATLMGFSAAEALAGMALIAVVVWRASRVVAVLGVIVLLGAAALSVLLRSSSWYLEADWLPVGLVVSIGTGAALRLGRGDSPLRQFLRAQWPVALALALTMMVDAGTTVDIEDLRLYAALPLLAAAATALCAVLGPRDPVRWTLTAAGIVLMAAAAVVLLAQVVEVRPIYWQPPFTIIGAHMVLVAYVVRYADRTRATVSVVALVGADLLAVIALMTGTRGMPDRDLLLTALLLLLVAVATGQYFGSRDRARNQSVRVAVTGAQQAERMALARELHDVVAHHVTGIVVQAQAAQLVADPVRTAEALGRIERSGTEALAAMRMLVGSMRGAQAGDSGAADAATADLEADLRAVVEGYTGPEVHLQLSLPDTLPPEAGRTVLRIVQEALTNVTKHAADAERVLVSIEPVGGETGGELRVRVSDDAAAARVRPPGGSGGYGLVGMRERVELLGGTFSAGPGDHAGWTVDARFPLRKDRL
ncbi:sensor histidine kinase [Actinokineospora guangxiensis]|uniref:histidine kinase n=1 Tax=Actinokineospora guangxiensis TaxID=1490288 RepID=A0ABW0EXI3_9PSEU